MAAGWGGRGSGLVPHGFSPESGGAVGARDLWVLGEYRCGGASCLALVRSTNGGKRFRRIAAPPFPSRGAAATLEFANTRDGFAFGWGSGPLYVTHDGGESWRPAGLDAVRAFALGGGYAYVVAGRGHYARSPVGRKAWRRILLPFPLTAGPVDLAAHGSHVWISGAGPSGRPQTHAGLARSRDHGLSFAVGAGPCFPGLPGGVVPTGNGVLWATCSSGMMAAAFRSTNGGRSFRHLATPPLINAAAIAPSSARDAVLYEPVERPLLRTTDGGAHWRRVQQPSRIRGAYWLDFATKRIGAVLVQTRSHAVELWRTIDAGATWRDVPIR